MYEEKTDEKKVVNPNLPPDRYDGDGELIQKKGKPAAEQHWLLLDGGTHKTVDVDWHYEDGHIFTQNTAPPEGSKLISVNEFDRIVAEQQR